MRPKLPPSLAQDEEGTQDVFKELVHELQKKSKLNKPVKEPMSMDWRAERDHLRDHFTTISMQHSFIPRLGELVLWCPNLEGEIRFNRNSEMFEKYSRKSQKFLGVPEWRAGTVSQVPEEDVVLQDVIGETRKKTAVNMSGFRVETFPDSNSFDKRLSSQYKYVPMSNIRPLNYWQVFLQGIPEKSYHDSIIYALTIMSSYSVLGRYYFKGVWPNASIYCRGIYLGAELLTQGDGVRLRPRISSSAGDPDDVTDVLVIKNIRLELFSCDADLSSPLLCKTTTARLIGKVYTLSPKRAYRTSGTQEPIPLTDEEVTDSFRCVGMRDYGTWYRLHSEDTDCWVSLDQVIGRCYESELMRVMFNDMSLGLDFEGVLSGRDYGQSTDQRIAPGKAWFCGDSRVETLALETLNGQEVGKYDDARDLKMWRANLCIIDGKATMSDIKNSKNPRAVGRPRAGLIGGRKDSSTFESVGKTSTMVSSALGPPGPSANVTSAPESESESESETESESERTSEETDELADIMRPMLYVRGGTVESSGGDYRPTDGPSPKRRKHG